MCSGGRGSEGVRKPMHDEGGGGDWFVRHGNAEVSFPSCVEHKKLRVGSA
jgi:hypothetical protein